METRIQYTGNLQYHEVYFSDLGLIKEIFIQKKNSKVVGEDFGLPFVLAKRDNAVVAFACLVISDFNTIDFVICEAVDLNAEEKEDFREYVDEYFNKKPSDNYRDPDQLKTTISRIITWIND